MAERLFRKQEVEGPIPSRGSLLEFQYSERVQRPHAIQVNAKLYRTSWSRLKDTLDILRIPYEESLKGNVLNFSWKGKHIKASSHWLYLHEQMPEMPINIPRSEIELVAADRAGAFLELLLRKTGLRCMRSLEGELLVGVRYMENAYPENEIAKKGLEDKNYIIYTRDPLTGKVSTWGDKSINPFVELETSSKRVDAEMKAFLQATENGEISPYGDVMASRRRLKELSSQSKAHQDDLGEAKRVIAGMIAQAQEGSKQLTSLIEGFRASTETANTLSNSVFNNMQTLNSIATLASGHDKLIVQLGRIMDELVALEQRGEEERKELRMQITAINAKLDALIGGSRK